MELDDTTIPGPSYLANLNEYKHKQLNVEQMKLEVVENDDVHFKLLQHEVHTTKSETVTTEDAFKSESSSTLDIELTTNLPLELKSEMLQQDCWFGNDENISVKQELMHEELNIKSEDGAIQESHFDDKQNEGYKLHKHMKHPDKIKPLKCNICQYRCWHKCDLKSHSMIHTGEKPFQCNICRFSSNQKGILTRHLKTHTDEKPFKCNICDKSFAQKGYLKDHSITHTKEKPFKCNICGYASAYKRYMTVHLRTHPGEKPFKCNLCEYSCRWHTNLKIHLKTHS